MPAALISDHHPEVPGHRSRACPRSALNALVSKSPKSTDSHPLRMAVTRLCVTESLFGLNGETNKHNRAITAADVTRFCHQIKRTKFSAHIRMSPNASRKT